MSRGRSSTAGSDGDCFLAPGEVAGLIDFLDPAPGDVLGFTRTKLAPTAHQFYESRASTHGAGSRSSGPDNPACRQTGERVGNTLRSTDPTAPRLDSTPW